MVGGWIDVKQIDKLKYVSALSPELYSRFELAKLKGERLVYLSKAELETTNRTHLLYEKSDKDYSKLNKLYAEIKNLEKELKYEKVIRLCVEAIEIGESHENNLKINTYSRFVEIVTKTYRKLKRYDEEIGVYEHFVTSYPDLVIHYDWAYRLAKAKQRLSALDDSARVPDPLITKRLYDSKYIFITIRQIEEQFLYLFFDQTTRNQFEKAFEKKINGIEIKQYVYDKALNDFEHWKNSDGLYKQFENTCLSAIRLSSEGKIASAIEEYLNWISICLNPKNKLHISAFRRDITSLANLYKKSKNFKREFEILKIGLDQKPPDYIAVPWERRIEKLKERYALL